MEEFFSSSLARVLWDSGVSTCMLNWTSQSKSNEKKLREYLGLGKYQEIIMGMIVGFSSTNYSHAPRKKNR